MNIMTDNFIEIAKAIKKIHVSNKNIHGQCSRACPFNNLIPPQHECFSWIFDHPEEALRGRLFISVLL